MILNTVNLMLQAMRRVRSGMAMKKLAISPGLAHVECWI